MDGYEITNYIRKIEGYKDVPIIALTADVIDGTRKKILDSGMNEYLMKPVNPERLFKTLSYFLNKKEDIDYLDEPKKDSDEFKSYKIISFEDGLERVNNNEKLYSELLEIFMVEHGGDFERIRAAVEKRDYVKVKTILHILKGTASNIGAYKISDEAKRLEERLISTGFIKRINDIIILGAVIDQTQLLIREYLDEEKINYSLKLNSKKLINEKELTKKLNLYLEYNDIQAYDYFNENIDSFKIIYGEKFENIKNALSKYEFHKALNIIKSV
jgi:CheY-like chemotaxis protein